MKTLIHKTITIQALKDELPPEALEVVTRANMRQDSWWAQLGWHDHYHMDNSAFTAGNAYIARQHQWVIQYIGKAASIPRIESKKAYQKLAYEALGRLTHTAQDLYAHSNYCALWLRKSPNSRDPQEIDPVDPDILDDPTLRSGKGTLLELLSFLIPSLTPWVQHKLGPDSHMHMNLDHPGRGPLYPYALAAAIKRTEIEYQMILAELGPDLRSLLSGKK